MFNFLRCFALVWCLGVAVRVAYASIDPLEIEGLNFVYKTNRSAFSLRGITFSMSNSISGARVDLLAETDTCRSLLPYFVDLGINVLAIKYLDTSRSHTECLDLLGEASIYVYAQGPIYFLDNDRWDQDAFDQTARYMDSFENHDAFLGMTLSEFDSYTQWTWATASRHGPLFKAVIRDLKRHNEEKGYRNIPIGLEVGLEWPNDNASFSEVLDYLSCGDGHADFLALSGLENTPSTSLQNGTTQENIDVFIPLLANSSVPVIRKGAYSNYVNKSFDEETWLYPGDTRAGNYDYISRVFEEEINGTVNRLSGVIVKDFIALPDTYGSGVCNPLMPINLSMEHEHGFVNDKMPGFFALASAFAAVRSDRPTLKQLVAKPTITSCSARDTSNVSLTLPPKNFPEICSCMEATLQCVHNTSLYDDHDLGNINKACEKNETGNCFGIVYDIQKGIYGAYSMCTESVRFSYAANRFWRKYGSSSCDFNGAVHLRDKQKPPYPECSSLLQKAGVNGENTVEPMIISTSNPIVSPTSSGRTSDLSSANSLLSTGSRAGIAVGVVVFAIFAVLGVVLLLLRRKRAARNMKTEDTPFQKSELDGKQVTKADYLQEVGDEGAVTELYVRERAHEITTLNDERIELPVKKDRSRLKHKLGSTVGGINGLLESKRNCRDELVSEIIVVDLNGVEIEVAPQISQKLSHGVEEVGQTRAHANEGANDRNRRYSGRF